MDDGKSEAPSGNDGKKSGWTRASEIVAPAVGWAAVLGVVAYSFKCAMKPTEVKDWKEARETLESFGLKSSSMQEDRLMYVLFRDILTSCHLEDVESRSWCEKAFYFADSLLQLEVALRSDLRVNPEFKDADNAQTFALQALFCLEKVQPARSKVHFLQLKKARVKLQQALTQHMRSVKCIVIN